VQHAGCPHFAPFEEREPEAFHIHAPRNCDIQPCLQISNRAIIVEAVTVAETAFRPGSGIVSTIPARKLFDI
jgi:hypothetical protein